MDITSRVTCIQKNEVSSVASDPKLVIEKLKDDNENLAFHAVISSQESDNKQVCLAHLSKLKVVRKDGKNMLRMTVSANKFDASGKYAKSSINLNNIHEGETTVILSELTPLNLNLIDRFIEAKLSTARLGATLNFCFGIDYFDFPGVENRGQRWFLLGRRAIDRAIVAVDIYGRCNIESDNTYFMYRSDRLNFIEFRTSELRNILTNSVNFNPPLSEEEYNRWVINHGNVTFGLSPFS